MCVMCWEHDINNMNLHSEDTGTIHSSNIVKTLDKQNVTHKPKEGKTWSGKSFFLGKLSLLEKFLDKQKLMRHNANAISCQLCSKKNISHHTYIYKNIIWNSGLYHYVDIHNVKPSSKFIRFVLNNDPTIKDKCRNSVIKIEGKIKKISNFSYVRIKTNQLMILDALMEHGGISPKYKEKHETGYKYSEHAGMLEFNSSELERVVISGSTQRSSDNDPEIFFPSLGDRAYDYEYIFHTHPLTPTPGGRIKENVLYEFPSTNDIYHFIEHFNYGRVQGSLVVTPEGLYNIRKYTFDKQVITVDASMGKKLRVLYNRVQTSAIKKYNNKFNKEFSSGVFGAQEKAHAFAEYFYSVIAQDTTPIDKCNELLKKYDLHVDYFPRQQTKNGDWILGTIYLPLCVAEKI
jgi:hypothetical protein